MAHVLTREPTRDDVGSDPRRPPVDLRHVAEVRDVREPVREHTSGTGRGIGDRDQLDAVTAEHGLQAEAEALVSREQRHHAKRAAATAAHSSDPAAKPWQRRASRHRSRKRRLEATRIASLRECPGVHSGWVAAVRWRRCSITTR